MRRRALRAFASERNGSGLGGDSVGGSKRILGLEVSRASDAGTCLMFLDDSLVFSSEESISREKEMTHERLLVIHTSRFRLVNILTGGRELTLEITNALDSFNSSGPVSKRRH